MSNNQHKLASRYGPASIVPARLSIYPRKPAFDSEFETIERKGAGHPDTISDRIAAAFSRAYSLLTIKLCGGLILHHQIDKLMIVGGKSKVYFGGSEMIKPVRVIAAGRATYSYGGATLPVAEVLDSVVRDYFRTHFPLLTDKEIVVENVLTDYAGPGAITTTSGAMGRMFSPRDSGEVRGYERYLANDTSYCVAYAPYSETEQFVLSLERHLVSETLRKKFPWIGTDIKIMAVRDDKSLGLTVCIPQIAAYVGSLNEYIDNVDSIGDHIKSFADQSLPNQDITLSINTKDDYQRFNIYLTHCGSSLAGDIGVVGRGNRTNGLITAHRPMSLEGTNGKNPRYYSGFIYANATRIIADRIYRETGEAAIVEIVSQNGAPLPEPWRSRIVCAAEKASIEKIFTEVISDLPSITHSFLEGGLTNS